MNSLLESEFKALIVKVYTMWIRRMIKREASEFKTFKEKLYVLCTLSKLCKYLLSSYKTVQWGNIGQFVTYKQIRTFPIVPTGNTKYLCGITNEAIIDVLKINSIKSDVKLRITRCQFMTMYVLVSCHIHALPMTRSGYRKSLVRFVVSFTLCFLLAL